MGFGVEIFFVKIGVGWVLTNWAPVFQVQKVWAVTEVSYT